MARGHGFRGRARSLRHEEQEGPDPLGAPEALVRDEEAEPSGILVERDHGRDREPRGGRARTWLADDQRRSQASRARFASTMER